MKNEILWKDIIKIEGLEQLVPPVVNVGTDDTLIFTHPGKLSEDACQRLREQLNECVGKVVVLEEGLRVSGCIKFDKSDDSEEHF